MAESKYKNGDVVRDKTTGKTYRRENDRWVPFTLPPPQESVMTPDLTWAETANDVLKGVANSAYNLAGNAMGVIPGLESPAEQMKNQAAMRAGEARSPGAFGAGQVVGDVALTAPLGVAGTGRTLGMNLLRGAPADVASGLLTSRGDKLTDASMAAAFGAGMRGGTGILGKAFNAVRGGPRTRPEYGLMTTEGREAMAQETSPIIEGIRGAKRQAQLPFDDEFERLRRVHRWGIGDTNVRTAMQTSLGGGVGSDLRVNPSLRAPLGYLDDPNVGQFGYGMSYADASAGRRALASAANKAGRAGDTAGARVYGVLESEAQRDIDRAIGSAGRDINRRYAEAVQRPYGAKATRMALGMGSDEADQAWAKLTGSLKGQQVENLATELRFNDPDTYQAIRRRIVGEILNEEANFSSIWQSGSGAKIARKYANSGWLEQFFSAEEAAGIVRLSGMAAGGRNPFARALLVMGGGMGGGLKGAAAGIGLDWLVASPRGRQLLTASANMTDDEIVRALGALMRQAVVTNPEEVQEGMLAGVDRVLDIPITKSSKDYE